MKCPYLEKWVIAACRAASITGIAGEKPYTPSLFQLHEYCKSKEHRRCPLYLRDAISSSAVEGVTYA